MWAWDTPRRRVTPEAGYNLEESSPHWLKAGARRVGRSMWLAETGYHNMTCGGKEYRNVACRDRIPQSSLRRREYCNLRDTKVSNESDSRYRCFRTTLCCNYENSSLLPESHD